ncbi:unnamed protein product [Nezara viridula]|uniref:NAD(P)H-hydrate epimerase n=1 Tax=Nezara viridula TaxID=85310 RepID=A0A9P0MTP2_NEZVI|nr:unnamed protein product [Nezara viridula]
MFFNRNKSFLSFVHRLILSRTMVRYLNQDEAINIDVQLFSKYRFSVDQLMELAGLSCANAIVECYPNQKKVLVCCGPGNNGGDGLVCARHLRHYGYEPSIFYPKRTDNQLYQNLTHQCQSLDIPFIESLDEDIINKSYDLVVDAFFGFSFKPPVRDTFVPFMKALRKTKKPICSIDIPSGWNVETGKPTDGIEPEMLISLTAPKRCAQSFNGKFHYLGGRFVPFQLAEEFKLHLPDFPGTSNFVSLKFAKSLVLYIF